MMVKEDDNLGDPANRFPQPFEIRTNLVLTFLTADGHLNLLSSGFWFCYFLNIVICSFLFLSKIVFSTFPYKSFLKNV